MLPNGRSACEFCEDPEPIRESPEPVPQRIALTDDAWRGELNQRLQAYRAKRRKPSDSSESQTQLPFQEPAATTFAAGVATAVEPRPPESQPVEPRSPQEGFAFTIAIGRPPRREEPQDGQFLIDVSLPPLAEDALGDENSALTEELPQPGIFPVASLELRRSAAWIDLACLLFAYGGFLTLFGSLGGHFTLSKLSATICFATFVFVYAQYFVLFTIFGGTTPGMMIRGLQLTTFSGEEPALNNLLLRAAGYLLSAGTLFMGFLWAMWDEDTLTWHDRISRTYLVLPKFIAEMDSSQTVPTR